MFGERHPKVTLPVHNGVNTDTRGDQGLGTHDRPEP